MAFIATSVVAFLSPFRATGGEAKQNGTAEPHAQLPPVGSARRESNSLSTAPARADFVHSLNGK